MLVILKLSAKRIERKKGKKSKTILRIKVNE